MASIPRIRAVLMHDATCLDKAISRGILAIYHKPPRCLIAIISWLPMVYSLIYHGFQPISIQGSNHPVYNMDYVAQEVGGTLIGEDGLVVMAGA